MSGIVAFLALLLVFFSSCTAIQREPKTEEKLLDDTLLLVAEVKQFERTLGIEPTEALSVDSRATPVASMLWLWLQKLGTLALTTPIDIRLALGFSVPREQVRLQRIYNVSGYSGYFRQGNQFGDAASVTTVDFAREKLPLKVQVIVHEDLHGARNFDLPWESEESLVTPLALLVALKFFEMKDDARSAQQIRSAMEEEQRLSREIAAFAREAEDVFRAIPLAQAREQVKRLLATYPVYERYYRHQTKDQDSTWALEAKVSHDLAYYKHYDRIIRLYEKSEDLKKLIQDLKEIPQSVDGQTLDSHLDDLEQLYNGAGSKGAR